MINAAEYIIERAKLCKYYVHCNDCPLKEYECEYTEDPGDALDMVEIVEMWKEKRGEEETREKLKETLRGISKKAGGDVIISDGVMEIRKDGDVIRISFGGDRDD